MNGEESEICDILIVGGGLAGGLAALALKRARPELDLRLIEPHEIGGNHIWSFFDGDISAQGRALLQPIAAYRWEGYEVRFPAYRRDIDMAYNSMSGEGLADAVKAALPEGALIKDKAVNIQADGVMLASRRAIKARHILDARGFASVDGLRCGWQKFVGQALKIEGGHGMTHPTVMDASVPQWDGYRFIYCLPFDADTMFVEDTYYSDDRALDVPAVSARIANYASQQGWDVAEISRTETGVLPVVMAGNFEDLWPETDQIARIGVRSGAFHATTGYSLPFAVETALTLPQLLDEGQDLAKVLRQRAKAHWRAQRFYRLLSTMLFAASEPEQRYLIFQRFYRLSPELVARFYAGVSSWGDRARILSGKPPVPVGRAISATKDLQWL